MERLDPAQKSGADVRRMFDAVAPRYDLLNRLLSAGNDVRWRREAVELALVGRSAAVVADACCGTGDLSLALAADRRVRRVVGFDFSEPMVRRAVAKGGRFDAVRDMPRAARGFVVGDALALPAADAKFDAVTIAFGLRNLCDPAAGIRELGRLLKPGGTLVVLEFFAPTAGVGAALFSAYFRHVLPRIGRLISGGGVDAYRYLPESVAGFAPPERVADWFVAAGFESVKVQRRLFGAVGLLTGVREVAAVRPAQLQERVPCIA